MGACIAGGWPPVCTEFEQKGRKPTMSHTDKAPDERVREAAADLDDPTAIDPVCGMDVDPVKGKTEHIERAGKTYFFCSAECRRQFVEKPEDYAI
jgi:YHS domain-containing protein